MSNYLSINSNRISSSQALLFDSPLVPYSERYVWLKSVADVATKEISEISPRELWIKIARKVYQFLSPLFADILSPESSAKKLLQFIEDFFLRDHLKYHETKDKVYEYLKGVSPVEFVIPTRAYNQKKLVKEIPFFKRFMAQSAAHNLHRDERNYYTYLQFMANHLAYRNLKVGDRLPMYLDQDNNPDGTKQYKVNAVFKNEHGLVAYGLVPERGKGMPMFLVQGTDKANINQLHADFQPNIGSLAVAESRKKIEAWFKQYTKDYRAIVAGHSLGGAISEVIMSEFSPHIQQVVTFNAPAPGTQVALKWEENAAKEGRLPKRETKSLFDEPVVHFWAKGDTIVECAGHWHLRGKMVRLVPDCPLEEVPKSAIKGMPDTYTNTPHSLPSLMFSAYHMRRPYLYEPGQHEPTLMGEGAYWLRDLLVGFMREIQTPDPADAPSGPPAQMLKV